MSARQFYYHFLEILHVSKNTSFSSFHETSFFGSWWRFTMDHFWTTFSVNDDTSFIFRVKIDENYELWEIKELVEGHLKNLNKDQFYKTLPRLQNLLTISTAELQEINCTLRSYLDQSSEKRDPPEYYWFLAPQVFVRWSSTNSTIIILIKWKF